MTAPAGRWARPEGKTWLEGHPGDALRGLPGLLDCVHCGLCLDACATYRATGDETLSPRGRVHLLRAVREGRLPAVAAEPALDSCLQCRACEPVCPSRVPYHELLEQNREGGTPWSLALALDHVLSVRGRLRRAAGTLRLARRLGLLALAEILPWARLRALASAVPARPRRYCPPPKTIPADGEARGRVGLHLGCVTAELLGGVLADTVAVLTAQGFEVLLPEQPACCGALHGHAGDAGGGRRLAAATLAAFPQDLDAVVVPAAGCAAWLHESDPRRAVREPLALLREMGLRPLAGSCRRRVAHAPPCHLQNVLACQAATEEVLEQVPGLELVPLREAELCCGAGGIAFARAPRIADGVLARKVEALRASGADTVVAGNSGCLLRIESGLRRHRLPIQALHPVQVLAEAMRD